MPIPRFHPAKGKLVLPAPGKAETGDGDTMRVNLPFRLVSVDTPEKTNYGGQEPAAQALLNLALEALAEAEAEGRFPDGFTAYFRPRVQRGGARRHYAAAEAATEALRDMRRRRLTRPDGKLRDLAVILAGEAVDGRGRALAYLAPFLDPEERRALPKDHPERRTFNLDLLAEGWAASFPVWPSFPSDRADFDRLLEAARAAEAGGLGNWARGGAARLLTGYEFRALIDIGRRVRRLRGGTARPKEDRYEEEFERRCVDARNGRDLGRFGFVKIPAAERLWAWTQRDATALRAWLGA